MGIRVVARIRPQQPHELDKDVIVSAAVGAGNGKDDDPATLVRIPSHKNDHEMYTFAFSGVYDQGTSQRSIFDNEGKLVSWKEEDSISSIFNRMLMIRSGADD